MNIFLYNICIVVRTTYPQDKRYPQDIYPQVVEKRLDLWKDCGKVQDLSTELKQIKHDKQKTENAENVEI